MIITTLSIILFLTFLVLGGFHFYWLSGGTVGLEKAIPTREGKPNSLAIPPIATLIVALILTSFGLLYLLKSGLVALALPSWITSFSDWFIPSIFIIRAIGEFNYVGIFKKVKNTTFAAADTQIFIPLCLCIGVMGFLIQLMGS